METAVRNGVATIEGECGGALACATCHVHIPEEWRAVTGEASADEQEMLEFGVESDERSRLVVPDHGHRGDGRHHRPHAAQPALGVG